MMLDSVKAEVEMNELLAADFPEVCYPIEKLDGIVNRTAGQLCNGKRTYITWTAKKIVLPTVPKSKSSGAICLALGITGRIRGLKSKLPTGEAVRPDFVIVDDPQTDESARSPSQSQNRENILASAILGLAGPGKKMSGFMPCTIIRPNDMAASILDREKHPEWQGETTQMVYKWPTNQALWNKYAELRQEEFRADGDGSQATKFYKKNRKEMDAGSVVAWDQRFNEDELSALQHAYNLKIRDEASFFSEYQNLPLIDEETSDLLTADEIAKKINGYKKLEVPTECEKITTFVDIQQKCLYYVTTAWTTGFTGYILDYGAYPDQKRKYFTLRDISKTLQLAKPGAGLEGAIYAGLQELTEDIMSKRYVRDDGAELACDLTLIDANWGTSTDIVHQFCRNTSHRGKVLPAHGRYVGASSKPFSDYAKRKGERTGFNWRMPTVKGKRFVRHVLFDSNFWKTFVHARFAQALGDPGCLSLYKAKPTTHRMIGDQMHAEFRIKTSGRGREVDEWKLLPNRPDNHLLDCISGSAVAASVTGCSLAGINNRSAEDLARQLENRKRSRRQRVSYL